MIIAIILILIVTAVVWVANKFLPFTVCPICAGVFVTWVWLVAAHFVGYQINLIIPAILMGGTVVGVMYKLEKKFSSSSASRLLLWKVMFVPAGFAAAYGVLEQLWTVVILGFAFMFLISIALLSLRGEPTSGLEEKMKDCC